MAGQVKHTKIFAGGIVPDAKFLSVLMKLPFRNTDGLIGAVAAVLKDRRDRADRFDVAAEADARERRRHDEAAARQTTSRRTSTFGYEMADAIAGLDIGQTIAVKHALSSRWRPWRAPTK